MRTLHLNVSQGEFHAVFNGGLTFIQHTTGMLWSRILKGRQFDRILVKYSDPETGKKIITARKWRGYEIHNVESPTGSFQVFAIRVGVPL